jgi:hypothetical protein
VRTSSCSRRTTCRAGAERERSSTGVRELALPGRQPARARSGWPAGRAPAAPARLSAARVSRWRLRAGPLCAAETRAAAAPRRSKAGAPAHARRTCKQTHRQKGSLTCVVLALHKGECLQAHYEIGEEQHWQNASYLSRPMVYIYVKNATPREAVGKRSQEGRRTSWQACRVLPCIRHVRMCQTKC